MDSNKQLKTGTTTVGLVTKDAVVLAADMRASMGHLAYDEEVQKVYKITERVSVTIAGSVGDALTLVRYLRSHAKLFEIERETKITPKALATFVSNILNSNRFYPFFVQFIIGGVNEKPEIYDVDPSGGLLERKKFAVTGSGTELALSSLDSNYKENLSTEEGIRLAISAVNSSKKRDIYSGGVSVKVTVIDKNGTKELSEQEIQKYSN
ncbi:archaeal proteasome endopeptidase complex subunit beta [Candidatus Micrarchaeota archaeon]|nr:archaeal proteasome endopeptidase complex subunit beta [Candidatus Micrarchaeota archaeon]MBU2476126.1 archaeal proteasome endopeptidase complex subunit beta [Candidatus Micrarchaeota archaeon]